MNHFSGVKGLVLGSALLLSAGLAKADTTITFDTDASGNPLSAPQLFADATALTELYAPLGVHFSGPASGDGGTILNETGNFGVNARSGVNFLAFNRDATLSDGNIPTDPETITFDSPVSSVSIFAGGGFTTNTFTLDAFDASNNPVGSSTFTGDPTSYGELSVSASSISKVVLTEQGSSFWVYDDLTFGGAGSSVPEPGSLALLAGCGVSGLALFRKRRR